ncbi:hypothetical protein Vafri_11767 [Volvox africanus]|uniref:Uncharacterized protein n=1 Tax=Volvox africanus TaxID=51714 RepID=A0A8J4B8A9_9CHLO|nr:hypothetical protein Vafri_11767 [Volvox africanus]
MSSMHEEYAEMSKKARRAGLLTVSQVEDIIDMRLNGPVLDSIIAKKLSQATNLPAGFGGSSGLRGLQGGASSNVALSFGRLTSGALRPGAAGPSWQPSSMQKQLASGGPSSASVGVSISGGEGVTGIAGGGDGSSLMVVEDVMSPASPMRMGVGGGIGGGGGGGGGGGSSDPALGLRLVTVESDMSRLFEAFKAFGDKVAPISEVNDLRQVLEDLANTVNHVKVGQGILGEAGEEAVRRHIHATLLPEMLQRQQQDTRRILGWMDEQLADVSKELYIVRRNQERLQGRMAELNNAGGGGGAAAAADVAEAAAADAAAAAAAASRLASTTSPIRVRHTAGRPMSASAALVSASSSAAFAALYGDGEAVTLTARVEALAEQLYFLSDALGVPLGRKAHPSQARATRGGDDGGGNGEESRAAGSGAAGHGGAERATSGVEVTAAVEGQWRTEEAKVQSRAASGQGDGGAATAVHGGDRPGGGATGNGGDAENADGTTMTELDVINMSLPSLVQRIQQLEAAVHSIAAGQQALAAAAAVTTTTAAGGGAADAAQKGFGTSSALQPRSSLTPPAAVTAAAVQGLVDAAVADLRLRLRLVEHEVPLMARSFEVKALKRMLQDTTAAAVANTTTVPVNGLAAPLGMFDSSGRTGGSAGGLPQPLTKIRANGGSRGGGGGGVSPALEMQITKRLNALELAVTTVDERGRALEQRWSTLELKWGSASKDTQGDLPRLQSTVSQLAKDVQRISLAQSSAPGGGGDGDGGGGGLLNESRSRISRSRGGLSLASSALGGVSFAGVNASSMAEVVNVEISGIAHDLAVAAHEELQRTRDGPLPDGTQDGIPTPAAVANREAALARLRRKPLEVAAHVELLESVKLHLDRLLRRATSCTTDRLVLLAAMSAMRVKLLENEAEAFREQIIAVFRSLERAFTALVKLQEAVASKSSATAVGQLATMLQDVSAGLATLAAHAAIRDSPITGPIAPRSTGSVAATAAMTAASAAVEQARRRQGSAGSSDVAAAAAAAASGGSLSLPTAISSGPLEDALSLIARVPSPTMVMRPASPVRLSGPGINTAMNRQHAAAARGAAVGGSGIAGGGGGVRLTSTTGTPVVTVLNQSWPGPKPGSPPVSTVGSGPVSTPLLVPKASLGTPHAGGNAGAGSGSIGPIATSRSNGNLSNHGSLGAAEVTSPRQEGAGSNRVWSGRRPGSGIANGLHVGMPVGSPGSSGGGGSTGGGMPPPVAGRQSGLSPMGSGSTAQPGLPSIGGLGLGPGRNSGSRS